MARAADEGGAPQGLVGILPPIAPGDLEGVLAPGSLPESWQPWTEAVTQDLNKLYVEPPTEIAEQKQALAQLRKREATAAKYMSDPKYSNIAGPLSTFQGGLKRRLDVAEAILNTLELGPEVVAERKAKASRDFNAAAANLSKNLNAVTTGEGWRKFLKTAEIQGAYGAKNEAQLVELAASLKDQVGKAPTDAPTQTFLKRPDIVALRTAADQLTAAAGSSVAGPELRQACTDLVSAIELSEAENTKVAAKGVRDAYSRITKLAPDGGTRITTALRANYFNHNVRLYGPESFINRLVSESRVDNSGINEMVEEAQVTGSQSTHSTVGIDVQPSSNGALMYLVINGRVNTSTLASTDQASVSIFGNANFTAYKPLVFDGERFRVGQTAVGARASNSLGNIDTKYDCLPIIRRIAQNQAYSIASSRLGEGESMMVNRIRGTVASQLDTEINREFGPTGELPKKIDDRVAALKKLKLFPSNLNWNSTANEVRMAGRLMGEGEIGGSTPDASQMNPRGITLMVHQSALNNAIDRIGFAGLELTDDEVRLKLEGFLKEALGPEVDFGKKAATSSDKTRKLAFDESDPIRVEVVDGSLQLVIRAGLKQERKKETETTPGEEAGEGEKTIVDVPVHIIRVPLSFTVLNEGIQINPGSVSVEAANDADKSAGRGGVIKDKIEKAIQTIAKEPIKRYTTMKRGNRQITLAVTRIRANSGWINVWVE